MLGQCLVPTITQKSHFFLFSSGTTTIYSTLKMYFNIKTFLTRMPKNAYKAQKTEKRDALIEKN